MMRRRIATAALIVLMVCQTAGAAAKHRWAPMFGFSHPWWRGEAGGTPQMLVERVAWGVYIKPAYDLGARMVQFHDLNHIPGGTVPKFEGGTVVAYQLSALNKEQRAAFDWLMAKMAAEAPLMQKRGYIGAIMDRDPLFKPEPNKGLTNAVICRRNSPQFYRFLLEVMAMKDCGFEVIIVDAGVVERVSQYYVDHYGIDPRELGSNVSPFAQTRLMRTECRRQGLRDLGLESLRLHPKWQRIETNAEIEEIPQITLDTIMDRDERRFGSLQPINCRAGQDMYVIVNDPAHFARPPGDSGEPSRAERWAWWKDGSGYHHNLGLLIGPEHFAEAKRISERH